MKINKTIKTVVAILSSLGMAAMASAQATAVNADSAGATTPSHQLSPVIQRELPFSQLGFNGSIGIYGSEANANVGFGSRLDEVIAKANLHFDVTPSPALLALVSHIKVYLNNELMGVVPVTDGQQGKKSSVSMPLDSRYFSNYNQIRFELIGNTHKTCSNPNDASIWAEISQSSRVELFVQKTRLESDLSLLPAPFFDPRDFGKLTLPVIMGADYDLAEIKAAGVLASHFGSLSGWRGAQFSLLFDQLPEQHAVVFVSNDNKPDFLRDFPDADGPYLQVITHPTNPYVKLLLVQGRDSQDLNTAVQGLALGTQLLTGPMAKINQVVQVKPRVPYDAPNWVDTSRPVAFTELVEQRSQLQVEGRTPPPVRLSFQLPPDLFTWQSRGIPMDLQYRYSPPMKDNSGSRLTLGINDEFVEAFNLTTAGQGGESKRVRVPLLDDGLLGGSDRVRIPAFKVGSKNFIDFEFGFASVTEGNCQITQPSKQYAVVDGDSTIDFSGFPHYIQMPNLRSFATSGFPFTRMADLSDTVVVLPAASSAEALQTFLNVMGRLGADAGYPAIKVTVTDQWDSATLKGKDILSIGVAQELTQAIGEPDQVNLVLQSGQRQIRLPGRNETASGMNWLGRASDNPEAVDLVSVNASGKFAAITGMESPFTKKRSLVAIMAASPQALSLVDNAIIDSGKVEHMSGSVVILRDQEVASYNVGQHYFVGQLPVLKLIWYHFSNHPVLVACLAVLLVVIVTVFLWRVLRKIAARRLARSGEDA